MIDMTKDKPVTFDVIWEAYIECRRRKKNTPGAKKFEANEVYNIQKIVDDINGRRYRLMPSTCFVVKYPTAREVFCASFRDRVVQHFVFRELNPIIERKLIRDTASCRVGKGTDYAIGRLSTFVRRETDNYTETAYALKGDLRAFFMSIDRELLYEKICDVVYNDYYGDYTDMLLYLLPILILSDMTKNANVIGDPSDWDLIPPNKTLFGNTKGIPIGNITSQMFANYLLNDFDHFIKSRHGSYVRYVDDFVIVHKDKAYLEETLEMINEFLPSIGQCLNLHKTHIQDVKYGVQFLGATIKPYYTSLSPKRINRMYYTTSTLKSSGEYVKGANSRAGMFRRYHGHDVAKRWYEHFPDDIKESVKMDSNYKFRDINEPRKQKQTKIKTIK